MAEPAVPALSDLVPADAPAPNAATSPKKPRNKPSKYTDGLDLSAASPAGLPAKRDRAKVEFYTDKPGPLSRAQDTFSVQQVGW